MNQNDKKVLLVIRDGWGYSPETKYNMIAQADTSYTDYLEKTYPTFLLEASGESVGLPEGYFGNSEVGHMTIGAGRPLFQSLLRINKSIADKSFFKNKELLQAISAAKERGAKLHLIGLLQKEGVHAHFNHLIALLELAKKEGLKKDDVYIHVITDGRDAEEKNAIHYVSELEQEIARIGIGKIVTLGGRYFAMDRDNRWQRVEKYYAALMRINLVKNLQKKFTKPQDYLKQKYIDETFSDEFLEPSIWEGYDGLQEGDVIINFSFRKDRARQLSQVFCDEKFSEFKIQHKNIYYVSMTEYYNDLKHVVFPDIPVSNILGKKLEENRKTQLRISETQKYAHVTYFFDGGEDYDFVGEKKILVKSSGVQSFDLKPEMESEKISKKLIYEIENYNQDFILCNFPNADMVGHSGNHAAIKKGVEAIDKALSKIIPVALKNDYIIILAADHGNAEYKADKFETSHTYNKIPFTCVSSPVIPNKLFKSMRSLADISKFIEIIMKI